MSFAGKIKCMSSVIDQIIRDAIERGEFKNLPGEGKPIDLTAYFNTPEEVRMAFSVLKSANVLPQEAELLKEMASIKESPDTAKDSETRAHLMKKLEEKRLEFNLLMDRLKRQRKV